MKLVEILARDLDKWPEADSEYGQIESMSQAGDYRVSHYAGVRQKWRKDLDDWDGVHGYVPCSRFTLSVLATDHATAIVTRADWEAERAKLKAPKANGDGWIRHRGGKCPVEAGTLVGVRYRNGVICEGVTALLFRGEDGFKSSRSGTLDLAVNWNHTKSIGDIMYYRIHRPAEQPQIKLEPGTGISYLPGEPLVSMEPADTMLAIRDRIRDRIRELDTQRAEVEATYQRQVSEITQERESLVKKLAGEGLALVEVVQPVKSLDDWRNWQAGDVVEVVLANDSNLAIGSQYAVRSIEGEEYDGAMHVSVWNGVDGWNWPGAQDESERCVFKFVSRPAS